MDPSIFKAYDVRGLYQEQLDEQAAWKIGHATAQFLRSMVHGYDRGLANAQSICVGQDMRTHSPSLTKALIEGMNTAGANVIDIGMIDTPQMYFAINHLGACGGVQVTASHNSAPYNGFKISGQHAKPIGADTGLKDIKHIATALLHTLGSPDGSVEHCDLATEYKRHVLKFLDGKHRPLKMVVDASNGMAGKMVPIIFDDLENVKLTGLNLKHDGTFKHDPNPLVEANLKELRKKVVKEKADFGFCFDGDADRLMMVDEKGHYFLKTNPGSTIVYDLRSSHVVQEEILKHGGTPRRERVGHAFMKKTLRDSHACFGGELSGHFYYRDNFYADSGMITLVHMLNILGATDTPASELMAPLQRYSSSGEVNFEVEDKDAVMQELTRQYSQGRVDDLDGVTVQ
ncbi:MAG: phosphomannomutase/phosphoglucomutase, partial [Planctomycetota bacterium]